MPEKRTKWRTGSVVSTLIHVALIVWLLLPPEYGGIVIPIEQGAGGPGPAGGGGGRSAARAEYISYVQAPPPKPLPKPTLVFTPPKVEPPPPPQLEPLKIPDAIVVVGASS